MKEGVYRPFLLYIRKDLSVSRGVNMPSFITIALVIDKDCNTPGTGSAVNVQ